MTFGKRIRPGRQWTLGTIAFRRKDGWRLPRPWSSLASFWLEKQLTKEGIGADEAARELSLPPPPIFRFLAEGPASRKGSGGWKRVSYMMGAVFHVLADTDDEYVCDAVTQ